MKTIMKRALAWGLSISSVVFTFVPESCFGLIEWMERDKVMWGGLSGAQINIVVSRFLVLVIFCAVSYGCSCFRWKTKKSVLVKGDNYQISVEYGELLEIQGCNRVIHFDECYSTHIGDLPEDIKADSLCGKYLKSLDGPIDIQSLVDDCRVKPEERVSRFQGQRAFRPGTILLNGKDLLMAFTRLDEHGRSSMTIDEYVECLLYFWEQLRIYSAGSDVCIPVFGAGLTVFEGGNNYNQQQLLDIIIRTYKLSSNKLNAHNTLRIICHREDGFSLGDINV